jgi:hypothetical protein
LFTIANRFPIFMLALCNSEISLESFPNNHTLALGAIIGQR